ncbi:hypothetical protein SDRG_06963 [Saprolegnia diclina VS20]|uniref:Uncharacterized protein n=1 Tax=Saprolegnia diclina (strain VS20) TaxID=1156394 RepID=T0RZ98_SAPDV|nr:hypothetical protein SDRG_06963 [Saprolegnia diclina VS20]EQC35682.1 hypothetical protein SDRG_06963 [Saprolegnia diclina VS20]|eukprot:XP_008610999.1 hypothetical protein SDRG_06963 [Saprolegnia diclina VS20]
MTKQAAINDLFSLIPAANDLLTLVTTLGTTRPTSMTARTSTRPSNATFHAMYQALLTKLVTSTAMRARLPKVLFRAAPSGQSFTLQDA